MKGEITGINRVCHIHHTRSITVIQESSILGTILCFFAVVEDSNVKAPTHYIYPLKKDIYTALVRVQVDVCHFFIEVATLPLLRGK